MSHKSELERIISKPSTTDEEVFELYDRLPSVTVEELFPQKWIGKGINTGHWGYPWLDAVKWVGKWYRSQLDAIPLVCYNEAGKLYSNKSMKGEASLWMIAFRGKTSATMVYDGVPIFDHLRKIDDDTLLGVMNGKHFDGSPDVVDNGKYLFFVLERTKDFSAEFVSE